MKNPFSLCFNLEHLRTTWMQKPNLLLPSKERRIKALGVIYFNQFQPHFPGLFCWSSTFLLTVKDTGPRQWADGFFRTPGRYLPGLHSRFDMVGLRLKYHTLILTWDRWDKINSMMILSYCCKCGERVGGAREKFCRNPLRCHAFWISNLVFWFAYPWQKGKLHLIRYIKWGSGHQLVLSKWPMS